MKSEKLKTIIDLINRAMRETPKGSTALALLKDARGMLNELGDESPIKQLSNAISEFTKPNYFQWNTFWGAINIILQSHKFSLIPMPKIVANNVIDGRVNQAIVSEDETIQTFITITWHFMEGTQRYEFVAYIHP